MNAELIKYEVKLNFEYRRRDGVRSELRASKRFEESFVPAVGWRIGVSKGDKEVSAKVTEIWWGTSFDWNLETLIVHTETQVYSDGDVGKSRLEHMNLLRYCGWHVSSDHTADQ